MNKEVDQTVNTDKVEDAVDDLEKLEDELNGADLMLSQHHGHFANPATLLDDYIFNHNGPGGGGTMGALISKFRVASVEDKFNNMKSRAQVVLDKQYDLLTRRPGEYDLAAQVNEIAVSNKLDFKAVLENPAKYPELNEAMLAAVDAGPDDMGALITKIDTAHNNPLRYQDLMGNLSELQHNVKDYAGADFNAILKKELENPASLVTKQYKDIIKHGLSDHEMKAMSELNHAATIYAESAKTYASAADKSGIDFAKGFQAITAEVDNHISSLDVDLGDKNEKLEESVKKIKEVANKILVSLGLMKPT